MSLSDQAKRVHYFHAAATALGGHLELPTPQNVAPQASLVLPAVGGHGSARVDGFQLDGIVSFKAAYTQVSGTAASINGPWSTMAMAVIEGLNVLNVFTADRVVAQIASEYPAQGYNPKITFAGTQFKNVHIAGSPVSIDLDVDMCRQDTSKGFPQKACIRDGGFLARVEEQCKAINTPVDNVTPVAQWARDRYKWEERSAAKDFVVCSLVKRIGGSFGGNTSGHIFEVPHFGRGFLGELVVSGGSFRLIMFRFELGCANHGLLSGCDVILNGNTEP